MHFLDKHWLSRLQFCGSCGSSGRLSPQQFLGESWRCPCCALYWMEFEEGLSMAFFLSTSLMEMGELMKLEWSCTVKDHSSTVFPLSQIFSISFLVMPTKASANPLLFGWCGAAGDMVPPDRNSGSCGTPWNCNKVHCLILAQMVSLVQ